MAEFGEQLEQWLEPNFPRANAEKKFQAVRSKTSSPDAAAAFMNHKLSLLSNLSEADSASSDKIDQLTAELSSQGAALDAATGGVGFGMVYTPQFKSAFQTGTGIAWGIVFSIPPGGSVSSWLYITAMNRASLGAEAFLAYDGQASLTFNVVDWSDPNEWSDLSLWPVHRDVSTMQDYIGQIPLNGANFPLLRLMNVTYLGAPPDTWVNEVHLLNVTSGVRERIYQRAYQATLPMQQTANGYWGPIVETHEPFYSGTNPMGCADARVGISANGAPFQWSPLIPPQAIPRNDQQGFKTLFVNPDFSWAVVS